MFLTDSLLQMSVFIFVTSLLMAQSLDAVNIDGESGIIQISTVEVEQKC